MITVSVNGLLQCTYQQECRKPHPFAHSNYLCSLSHFPCLHLLVSFLLYYQISPAAPETLRECRIVLVATFLYQIFCWQVIVNMKVPQTRLPRFRFYRFHSTTRVKKGLTKMKVIGGYFNRQYSFRMIFLTHYKYLKQCSFIRV